MANKITTLLDFKETGGLKKIKADVAAADTATGKFKAGWQGAMTTVKAYGAEAALAVGTTLVVASVKAGQEFANAAVEVGRFSDATGLSAEQASKWTSVADDLGVNVADVEKAFLRLNKEIGEGDGVAEEYGITLKRTADGAADVNGTMLETIKVINGIEDPTERARVAQELFGRSYANVAEIIFEDADKVASALESTSDAQIFDDDEIRKAREYRAAMDRFNDVMVDLKMTVGEGVVPVLTDAANAAVDFKEAVDAIPGVPKAVQMWWDNASPQAWIGHVATGWRAVGGALGLVNDEGPKTSKWVNEVATDAIAMAGALDEGAEAAEGVGEKTKNAAQIIASEIELARVNIERFGEDGVENMGDVEEAVVDVGTAWDRLKTKFSDRSAWLDVEDAFDDLADAWDEAMTAQEEGAEDADAKARVAERAMINLKTKVIDYATEVGNVPDEITTKILADIDAGKLAEAEAALDELERARSVTVWVQQKYFGSALSEVRRDSATASRGGIPPRAAGATGGIVTQPTMALIGEAGPEAVIPLNRTPGSSPLPSNVGGGVVINMTVNSLATNGDEFARDVVKAVEREMRFRGPLSGWG